MTISFDYNFAGFWVILALVISLAISWFVYYRNTQHPSLLTWQKGFLALVRFMVLFLLFVLLLSPLISKNKKFKQLPILSVAIDNSLSMQKQIGQVENISRTIKDRFSKNYKIEFRTFGEKVQENETIDASERRSDYGQLLKTLNANYINQNIGAMILVGDGIYNQGQNPAGYASNLKFPIYTVGLGDTSLIADAAIKNVRTNKVTFLKNKFPVEIEMKFEKLRNKMAHIEIENKGKIVYSTMIPLVSDDEFKLEFIKLEALNPGLQHYKIKISNFEGETNLKNNEYEFVIQVLENKQKILMLSDGPHPDLGAIRNSLSEFQEYETEIVSGTEIPDDLKKYSLIILNQLPSLKNYSVKLIERIRELRIPVLFIIGPNTILENLNAYEMGLNVQPGKLFEEVQASFDDHFSLFRLSNETKELLAMAPPLVSPFGDNSVSPMLQSLSFQRFKNITSSKSLMAFGNLKGQKVGFIVGEGIWRWRLVNYQIDGNHEAFNELIVKMIQYLALKENEDNFNVYHPAIFNETDDIQMTAELYNDGYELINEPDVTISIKNDSLNELNYTFDRMTDYYSLNIGHLKFGDYSYTAQTELGNQPFIEKGNFSIIKNEIELQNSRSDFGLMFQLAKETGGLFSTIEHFGTLLDSIESNDHISSRQRSQTFLTEWINLKTLFLLILFLLSVEWFFRKYWGSY